MPGKVGRATSKGPQIGKLSSLDKIVSHPQVNVVALAGKLFKELEPELLFLAHEPVNTIINSQYATRATVPYVVEVNRFNGEAIFKARLFEGSREGS